MKALLFKAFCPATRASAEGMTDSNGGKVSEEEHNSPGLHAAKEGDAKS